MAIEIVDIYPWRIVIFIDFPSYVSLPAGKCQVGCFYSLILLLLLLGDHNLLRSHYWAPRIWQDGSYVMSKIRLNFVSDEAPGSSQKHGWRHSKWLHLVIILSLYHLLYIHTNKGYRHYIAGHICPDLRIHNYAICFFPQVNTWKYE